MLAERETSSASTASTPSTSSAGSAPRAGCRSSAPPTIVLVIDGFGALRDDFDDLDEPVADLFKRGGGYGIHVVAGMLRWNDVRIATQSIFGTASSCG